MLDNGMQCMPGDEVWLVGEPIATPIERRNLVERMFCRLKDWRRIATRYDKLARNFISTEALAATIIW